MYVTGAPILALKKIFNEENMLLLKKSRLHRGRKKQSPETTMKKSRCC
jgi:hypothetical protein